MVRALPKDLTKSAFTVSSTVISLGKSARFVSPLRTQTRGLQDSAGWFFNSQQISAIQSEIFQLFVDDIFTI
jgi:hypothetical protein